MAYRDCAVIDINSDGEDYVNNVSVCWDADYEYLQSVWPSLTGMRLQWIDELEPAPGFVKPVWLNWTNKPDGWHPDPSDIPEPPDAN